MLEMLWNEVPLAKFRRTDRADLRYFVDWADTAKPEENEYLQLCKDAGWESVHTMSYCHIYASTPGALVRRAGRPGTRHPLAGDLWIT